MSNCFMQMLTSVEHLKKKSVEWEKTIKIFGENCVSELDIAVESEYAWISLYLTEKNYF